MTFERLDPHLDGFEALCAGEDVAATLAFIERTPGIESMADEVGTTALIAACMYADLPVLERLCHLGADVNARAEMGDTPLVNLVQAARFGEARDPIGCARWLLAHGADADRLVYDGTNALRQAIIDALLRCAGARGVEATLLRRAFELASAGHWERLEDLIAEQPDLARLTDEGGQSLLFVCAGLEGGADSIALLCRASADPSLVVDAGFPALHWAISQYRLGHARVLLERGADPRQTTVDVPPETALERALRMNCSAAIDLLKKEQSTSTPGGRS